MKTIKAAILQSQARAIQMVNQEQLSLYYGIGRYVSEHSRKGYWGTGAIGTISKQLKSELPGLKGFSEENIKLMRRFYETWKDIETISVVETTDLQKADSEADSIRQLRLTSDDSFPITAFLNISFTHHVAIFRYAKEYDERKYYMTTVMLCPITSLRQYLIGNWHCAPSKRLRTPIFWIISM